MSLVSISAHHACLLSNHWHERKLDQRLTSCVAKWSTYLLHASNWPLLLVAVAIQVLIMKESVRKLTLTLTDLQLVVCNEALVTMSDTAMGRHRPTPSGQAWPSLVHLGPYLDQPWDIAIPGLSLTHTSHTGLGLQAVQPMQTAST